MKWRDKKTLEKIEKAGIWIRKMMDDYIDGVFVLKNKNLYEAELLRVKKLGVLGVISIFNLSSEEKVRNPEYQKEIKFNLENYFEAILEFGEEVRRNEETIQGDS